MKFRRRKESGAESAPVAPKEATIDKEVEILVDHLAEWKVAYERLRVQYEALAKEVQELRPYKVEALELRPYKPALEERDNLLETAYDRIRGFMADKKRKDAENADLRERLAKMEKQIEGLGHPPKTEKEVSSVVVPPPAAPPEEQGEDAPEKPGIPLPPPPPEDEKEVVV